MGLSIVGSDACSQCNIPNRPAACTKARTQPQKVPHRKYHEVTVLKDTTKPMMTCA